MAEHGTPQNDKALIEATIERAYTASSRDMDYAQQLISMLERKNRALNIVWPVLLVIAIGLGFTLFSYYQDDRLQKAELDSLKEKVTELKAAQRRLEASNDQYAMSLRSGIESIVRVIKQPHPWLAENDPLNKEIPGLSAQSELPVIADVLATLLARADSTFDVQRQALERVQQQLIQAQTESANSKSAFAALQRRVEEQASELARTMQEIDALTSSRNQSLATIQQQVEDFKKENIRLQKEVNSRISAFDALAKRYKEMQAQKGKLLDDLDNKDKLIDSLKNQLSREKQGAEKLTASLAQLQQEMSAMKDRNQQLEQQLNALVRPIGTSGAPQKEAIAPTTAPVREPKPLETGVPESKFPEVKLNPGTP